MECKNFDLCGVCEDNVFHYHPMIRMIHNQTAEELKDLSESFVEIIKLPKVEQNDDSNFSELDKQKIEYLNATFPINDKEAQLELIKRYSKLDFEGFKQEIQKYLGLIKEMNDSKV